MEPAVLSRGGAWEEVILVPSWELILKIEGKSLATVHAVSWSVRVGQSVSASELASTTRTVSEEDIRSRNWGNTATVAQCAPSLFLFS